MDRELRRLIREMEGKTEWRVDLSLWALIVLMSVSWIVVALTVLDIS